MIGYVKLSCNSIDVTILILIDGFLQYVLDTNEYINNNSHNPYFNRWFSAIWILVLQKMS